MGRIGGENVSHLRIQRGVPSLSRYPKIGIDMPMNCIRNERLSLCTNVNQCVHYGIEALRLRVDACQPASNRNSNLHSAPVCLS